MHELIRLKFRSRRAVWLLSNTEAQITSLDLHANYSDEPKPSPGNSWSNTGCDWSSSAALLLALLRHFTFCSEWENGYSPSSWGENSVTFESSNVQSQLLNILLQQSTSVLTTVRGTGSVCYLRSFSYAVKLKKEKCLLVHSQFPCKSWIWLHFGITWDRFLTENASSFLINPFRDPNSIQKLTLLM